MSHRNRYTAYPKKLLKVKARIDQTVEIAWVSKDGKLIGHSAETVPEVMADLFMVDEGKMRLVEAEERERVRHLQESKGSIVRWRRGPMMGAISVGNRG